MITYSKISIIFFSFFISLTLSSKNYYVDATSGDDTNSGNSTSAAWKSLSKVNATTFAAVRNNTIYNISKNAIITRFFDGRVVEHNICSIRQLIMNIQ
jgi:hypothetical protein